MILPATPGMDRRSIFVSAITDSDGTINVGYLVLWRSGTAVICVIVAMVVGTLLDMWLNTPHTFNAEGLGKAIALLLAAYAALLTGMAAYIYGDSRGPSQPKKPPSDVNVTVNQ